MIKHSLIVILILLGVNSFAQEDKKHILKANILSPIFNTLNISYENALDKSKSITIGVSYMDFDDFGKSYNSDFNRAQGGTLTTEYRVYYSDKVLNGGYIAPFARYMYYNREAFYSNTYFYNAATKMYQNISTTENSNYQSIGLGFTAGYQFTLKNTFSIDFFGGPVYQILAKKERKFSGSATEEVNDSYLSNNIPNRYLSGYGLRLGITIGMMF